MKKSTWLLLILTFILIAVVELKATAQDTLKTSDANKTKKGKKEFKNTIHMNVTNPLIFGSRAIIFGYERVMGKHQSFTVDIGSTDFPSLNIIGDDSLKAKNTTGQSGLHVSGDYRFYLAKENKYEAPHGLYIGPYFGYNKFERDHTWTITSVMGGAPFDVDSKTIMSVTTVGFQMGYQFILWKRVSLDLIMIGPGVAFYSLKASLGTNLSEADRQKFFEKLNDALTEKFPGYAWTLGGGDFKVKGSTNTTSFGYKYVIQIGFRF
ncbi:MAG TPA: hypothetical protein VMI12_13880 [Puia sp.]|nr:hypothetical protein [Puia sp.]